MTDGSEVGKSPVVELAWPLGEVEWPAADQARPSTLSWRGLIEELSTIRALEQDWDGQGAEAPGSDLVDGAIHLALRLSTDRVAPADRVVAGVNGTIFLEWFSPRGYLEVEVTAPGEAEVRSVEDGSSAATERKLRW